MQITGGTVAFERKTAPAQYEGKHARIELSFALAEGEDLGSALDDVAELAKGKALEMVGLAEAPATGRGKRRVQAPNPEPSPPDLKNKDKEPAKSEKPKADDDPFAADAGKPNISTTPEDRKDPGHVANDPDADIFGDAGASAKAKEVTDKDLVDAVGRINGKLQATRFKDDPSKAAQSIRFLVSQYVTLPKGIRDIPADKRQDFLDNLEALAASK